MRIGILNSGGDCPGLNAVIHGVVGAASQLGWEVIGFKDGFEGLLPPGDYKVLKPIDTLGILKLGGTILGTTNKGHFAAKIGKGDIAEVPPDIVAKAKRTMDQLEIRALIIVGGDGSLTTGLQLYREGWPIIGVPKTIDNDLMATAMTFGFDSAVSTVVDALDRLHTTAESHKRIMVLEVMGRHAGWIALWGGIAGGAAVILLPEIPFDTEKVAEFIKQRDAQGHHSTLVVVAEVVALLAVQMACRVVVEVGPSSCATKQALNRWASWLLGVGHLRQLIDTIRAPQNMTTKDLGLSVA